MLDVEDDLALNEQIVIEREGIQCEVHRPLDRVFDRNKTEIDIALLDGLENLGDRPEREEVARREVGLAQYGLLTERAERTEKTNAQSCIARGRPLWDGGAGHEAAG